MRNAYRKFQMHLVFKLWAISESMTNDLLTIVNGLSKIYMGHGMRKPVFGDLWITKVQTSLCIHAVWSAPFLFTYCKLEKYHI